MTKHTLFAVIGAAAISTAASAATLSVSPDKPIYQVGETITLTVTASVTNGIADDIFGRFVYNGSLVDNVTTSQTALSPNWSASTVPYCLDSNDDLPWSAICNAFNQFHYNQGPFGVDPTTFSGTLATVTLTAQAPGVVDVNWELGFHFFDLPPPLNPAASFTVVVPEAGTAALVGLGLSVLAVRRRH